MPELARVPGSHPAHVEEQLGYHGGMLIRYALVGLVLAGCGKSDAQQQGAPASASAPAPLAPATATPSTTPTPPSAAGPPPAGSGASKDEAVRASTSSEQEELERAIAPYSEQARKSYSDAKKRFLAGLPSGHQLAVLTKLHSPGRTEAVFVKVTGIAGDQITGRIDNVQGMAGYKAGDAYTLSERDIVDWVIVHPDGSEEGNLVGKFLDERRAKQHP